MILFLSFSVIIFTLLVQGGTLRWLIRWLNLPPDGSENREENIAHLAAAEAALKVLNQSIPTGEECAELVPQLRAVYEHRVQYYQTAGAATNHLPEARFFATSNALRLEILHVQREAIIRLRDQGIISNSVLRRLERYIDFEEIRLAD
ncbi:MAG: Na+/H+ antiporter [Schlesneria sp.]|nr:Na+/H+ antiporter [Schlesneria sp.]